MLKGTGVSEGIGYASALIWGCPISDDYIPRKSSNPTEELARLNKALDSLLGKIQDLREDTFRKFGRAEALIFDAYAMILQDNDSLILPMRKKILERSITAEHAVSLQFKELADFFKQIDNEYMQQRAEDAYALGDQLLREMMGIPFTEATHMDRPSIVVAHSLSPTDIARLDLSRLEGIICTSGSANSHMSIIARSLGIPAVVGAAEALNEIRKGQIIAMDGETGEIWLSPKDNEVDFLRKRSEYVAAKRQEAQLMRGKPTITLDGHRIELAANVSQIKEVEYALAADAEAIGLFKTEAIQVLSMAPDEDVQFEIYRDLLRNMNGKAVTIRTFDSGGRTSPEQEFERNENNPALGYRGIRMSLGRPSVFRLHLRALLKASAYGSLRILLPMISNLDELNNALIALEKIKAELRREQVPFNEKVPVGIMISIPAAALLSEAFAPKVDFFSIAINDLVQFTLAIDKTSSSMSYLYNQLHPAVLRLIKHTVDAAHTKGIHCNICGDSLGHEQTLPVLLGLGVDGFSLNPSEILSTRKALNTLNYSHCRQFADKIINMNSASEVSRAIDSTQLAGLAAL